MPTRILLLEDNPGDAVIFREKLTASDLDFSLVHADRLSKGIEQLGAQDFDILMVDLSLPDAQGIETVMRVREAAPHLPLIVLTGLDDANAAAEAKKQGAVDYLVKWYVDSVSLARYIRYAIAQYRMFRTIDPYGREDAASAAKAGEQEPARGQQERVVEGPRVQRQAPVLSGGGDGAEPEPGLAEPAGDALREALDASPAGVVVVTEDRRVAFANAAARAWVDAGEERYPWPVEVGRRRIAQQGQPLEQEVISATWGGAPAYLITLRPVEATPEREPQEAPTEATPAEEPAFAAERVPPVLFRATEAALAFVERVEQRSGWMVDVLRSALDLHRVYAEGIEPNPEALDLLELAEQAVREHRPRAMQRGLPLRVTSPRSKVMAWADRNLVSHLLRRLVVDAVQGAGSEGVRLAVELEGPEACIVTTWESSGLETSSAEACADLGQQVVEQLAERAGGRYSHHRTRQGEEVITVHFPGPEGA